MKEFNFIKDWIDYGSLLSSQNGKLILGWGERKWINSPSTSQSIPSFYFPDFFLSIKNPWFTHAFTKEIETQKLIDLIKQATSLAQSSSPKWTNPYETHFQKTFLDLKRKFATHEIDKAVPFIFEHSTQKMETGQRVTSILSLLKYSLNNSAHLYGFWGETEGMLGATPEILFKFVDAKKLETVACAGTMSDQQNTADFLSSVKERHEHQLVIDGIKEALTGFGKVHVLPPHLLKLSQLAHLVTPITVDLDNSRFTYVQIVDALHPTPAVGTFPKEKGKQWLEEYQSIIDRGRYGAPCGVFMPDCAKSSCFVAIRNVQWGDFGMKIGAGGGQVAESELDQEWAEINLKLSAIKEMLAL